MLALACLRDLSAGGARATKSLARYLRVALYAAALAAFITFPGPSDRWPHPLLAGCAAR